MPIFDYLNPHLFPVCPHPDYRALVIPHAAALIHQKPAAQALEVAAARVFNGL